MASSEEDIDRKYRSKKGSFSYTTSCDEFDDEDPGEQRVEDVTIQFFYKPRTITMLAALILLMIYFAFERNADINQHDNFWHGTLGVVGSFLVISLLICPNGPFVRPHPAVWRLVLGISIVYTLALVFAMFQRYNDIITILRYFDPELTDAKPDTKTYADDCSLSVLWSRIDIFVVAHFLGWMMKALMLRHAGLLWLLSIMWEVTEIAFAHLLKNFQECWWDSILLDILICNGLGIHFGLYVCKKLEMRKYHWESIKDIQGTSKRIRRAVLQFTPISWTEVRWFDPKCVKMRFIGLCGLVIIWQISELNTFFLKHIFIIPTGHWINVARVIFIGIVAVPSLRQFYIYITDTRCKRVGTQCWMFICITFLEFTLSVRHAQELFSQTEFISIACWLGFMIAVCLVIVYLVVMWGSKQMTKREKEIKRSSHHHLHYNSQRDREYEGDNEEITPKKERGLRKVLKNKDA
ncbi:phosphatidylserine synthase isoform X1 [Hydra vulgaris]|nr:phosphatidylserine synthase-like [Hydra vulgaris]